MATEQHRIVILVNAHNGHVYPTGNKKSFKKIGDGASAKEIRQAFFDSVMEKESQNSNYNVWAESVKESGFDNFFVVVVKDKSKKEAKKKASKIITDNEWIDVSLNTYATKI
ncbi:hypothetical protein KW539_10935 [Vibrio fluvialis]|nr:hypothetical protein [Vibrio fluvialis]MBY8236597.1 hypothetical protein [Vibrio fluvialis]MBY8240527.1 hypothetical protein [Vibrio fluvialis]